MRIRSRILCVACVLSYVATPATAVAQDQLPTGPSAPVLERRDTNGVGGDQPTLCLELQPVPFPEPDHCFAPDDVIEVQLNMGFSDIPICGAQFFLQYDTSILQLIEIEPGGGVFNTVLFEFVDPIAGIIDYAISDDPSGPCEPTNGPATIAILRFDSIADCRAFGVAFRDHEPPTVLAGAAGQSVCPAGTDPVTCALIDPCDSGPVVIDVTPPEFNCPFPNGTLVEPEVNCSSLDLIEFDEIVVTEPCQPELDRGCTVEHFAVCVEDSDCPKDVTCGNTIVGYCDGPGPDDLSHLLAGGDFPAGRTIIQCEATNDCGFSAACGFEVRKPAIQTLVLDVELSPTMDAGNGIDPLVRCMHFELRDCNAAGDPSVQFLDVDLEFGGAANPPARARAVVTTDVGNWRCITVQDPLHTLPTTCSLECIDNFIIEDSDGKPIDLGSVFYAELVDAPLVDEICHWLINGDLNADGFVDVVDFSIYVSQNLTVRPPDTPCDSFDFDPGSKGPPLDPDDYHADINADGRVDVFDFSFILINFAAIGDDACDVVCEKPPAPNQELDGPRVRVSCLELERLGLRHSQRADLDNDGWIDGQDMMLFLNSAERESRPSDVP